MNNEWIKTRWVNREVDFEKGNISVKNCKVLEYNNSLDAYVLDKVDGFIPIEYLYMSEHCIGDLG